MRSIIRPARQRIALVACGNADLGGTIIAAGVSPDRKNVAIVSRVPRGRDKKDAILPEKIYFV